MAPSEYILHQLEVGPVIGSGVLSYTLPVKSVAPVTIGSYSDSNITGWQWDKRVWSEDSVENYAAYIPINWDPTVSGITQSYFQSGIGSNQDLKLQSIKHIPSSGVNEPEVYNVWAPELEHGYYYDYDEQDYLFSDDSEVLFVTYSGVSSESGYAASSGFNEVELSNRPKVSIPIQVRQMEWDQQIGKYNVYKSLQKKVLFSGQRDDDGARVTTYNAAQETILWTDIDRTLEEFIVQYDDSDNFKVILNNQYVTEVGSGVIPTALEFLGYTDGTANQQFHTKFSPVDSTQPINIYSYISNAGPFTQWTAIDFDEDPVGNQVRFDYDLGILEFGDPDEGQTIPAAGATIGINYWKTFYVEYEPDYTRNTILATEANVNPIYRRSSRGFVYLATRLEDPSQITLTAALPETGPNEYGPLNIGNAFTSLTATVKDSKGQLLEGQTVQFFITSEPVAGSFGGFPNTATTSSTDENGEAKSFYNSPRNISEIGENITASGWAEFASPGAPYTAYSEVTKLTTSNLLIEGDLNDVFLYEVYTDDPIQGYYDVTQGTSEAAQLNQLYDDFFTENQIDAGGTRNQDWEAAHRTIWDLATPALFLSNPNSGRKKIVATLDSTARNPYTFGLGAVSPVQPINVEDLGDGTYNVVFDTSNFDIPQPTASLSSPSGSLYSYFVVAPTKVHIQASVYNARLNQDILSNEISIKLNIPSYLSGLWLVDAINQNEIDQVSQLLASGIVSEGDKIPLGFRLRSSRVTLAAALDGVTFLDINRSGAWYDDFDSYPTSIVPEAYDPYDPDLLASGVRLSHQVTVSGII